MCASTKILSICSCLALLLFMSSAGGPRLRRVDRDEAGQPDLTEAQRKRKASGEARAARSRDNTFHARKAKLAHLIDHLPQALWDAFLDKAVRPRVKAISERGVICSLLLGFLVRDLFTLHVADQLDAQGQPLSYTDTDNPYGSGTIGCRGVPVNKMQKEAVKQFRPERVVLVDEFRTSRVSSADNTPSETLLDTPPESFRWLRPVKSMAKRSQVRGLMCLTSINNITRFYDRDVSAALNIRRCAVGPGPRPTELCYWPKRPAMPKPGQPGQEWVEIADKPLVRHVRCSSQGNACFALYQRQSRARAASLLPYLGFLYFLHSSKKTPGLTLFGFYFLLAFVGATIPAGIYAKSHYGTSLANVDWLHGCAESLLTVTNLLIVLGFRQGIREAEAAKAGGHAEQQDPSTSDATSKQEKEVAR
ncbi:hypothetical protein QJQ45_019188 [Haematococcus lacustris]|nr:hypothetical protein QJQ45_019188 [Haematococcus lacustris]